LDGYNREGNQIIKKLSMRKKTNLRYNRKNKKTTRKYEKVYIGNVPLTCCSFIDILVEMYNAIEKHRNGSYISITNTESLYHATKIPSHAQYINNADFSCCDGFGVLLAGKMLGHNIPRLHGPDLMLKCCEYGVVRKWRHFFYGGKNGVPEILSKKLTEKFPGLITAGTYSPPFRSLTRDEDEAVINQINIANPDIMWVGLGLLKQERWIAEHIGKINVPWMVGVGAAFDFHSGTIKRAPRFFRRIGLEWLYRTVFEPRMIRRQLRGFALLFSVAKESVLNRSNK
jgi:N-acetylglucosaminyldiphosphoundecaprenol N-acetyl-beta-D-mannosaminyltransferase